MIPKRVSVIVQIRQVETGIEGFYLTDVEEQYVDNQSFYYGMGNGSCDCNRKQMWGETQGIEYTDEETPCGNSAYKVRVGIRGGVVLDELEGA